jgi:hypothetical protein
MKRLPSLASLTGGQCLVKSGLSALEGMCLLRFMHPPSSISWYVESERIYMAAADIR